MLSSILSLSFLCSSVSEALFILSFSYLSERFFFVHDKAALARSLINNTGVTGQSLPTKNDFEHARGQRNSAYAVNLTYETYRRTYNWASEASPTLGCSIEISRDIQCIQLVKYKNHPFLPFCYFPLQIERK